MVLTARGGLLHYWCFYQKEKGMSDSYVDSIWPAVGCLTKIEKALNKRFAWVPTNNTFQIASSLIGHASVEELLLSNELLCIASESAEEINVFLKEYGCNQEIRDFPVFGPGGKYRVATAARLEAKTDWEGTESSLVSADAEYGALATEYKAFTIDARVRRNQGNYQMGLGRWIEIAGLPLSVEIHYEDTPDLPDGTDIDVTVPCVSVVTDNDMSWAIGAEGNFMGPVKTLSGSMYGLEGENTIEVEQAVQTSRFDMDAKGALVRSTGAMQFCLGTGYLPRRPKMHVIVDKPFSLSVTRPGFPRELMYGHLAQDVWRVA